MTDSTHRIPSLDGLRAFSIVLVLFAHVAGTPNAYQLAPLAGDLALFGVRIFFMISGFLITFLLIREQERDGNISLKGFYYRRASRILPVFFSYLLVLAILGWLGDLHVKTEDLWTAATFTANVRSTDWNVGHFWSLSTEEQFYLLWPALIALAGIKKSLRAALVLLIVSPVVSGIFWKLEYPHLAMLGISVNAIAGGCVLAGVRPRLHLSSRYMQFLKSQGPLALGLLALILNLWDGHGAILLYGVETLLGMIFLDRLITFQDTLTRFLNWKPIVFLGMLSYSLYIWQQIFLNRTGHAVFNSFPLNLILALTCSVASFFLIERPFLMLKRTIKAQAARRVEPNALTVLDIPARTLS